MDAARTLRRARARSRLSLRALAARGGTSHSTLTAYEAGRVVPTVETFERIARAAGFTVTAELVPTVASDAERGRELVEVLLLAEQFPARHAPTIEYPVFRATAEGPR